MNSYSQTMERVNSRLAELLNHAQGTLQGEGSFAASDVRALRAVLTEAAPIIAQSKELREAHPELGEPLQRYRLQLVHLQQTVERLRITLLVRKATIEASQTRVSAASQWFEAFQKTR